MAQIIPIKELKDTSAISARCKNSDEPIFITKNGYGDMVLMSIEVYNRTIASIQLSEQLKLAERDVENGNTVPLAPAIAEMKKKYDL